VSRDDLVLDHLPQVRCLAQGIRRRLPPCVPLDDLVHAGVLGLLEAVDRFNPQRHVRLKTFAALRIRGAILDSLRQMDWGPRALRRYGRRLEEVRAGLQADLGRQAADPELAGALGLSLARYHALRRDLAGLERDTAWDQEAHPASQADDPYRILRAAELRRFLARALAQLPEKERYTLTLYYLQELPMTEVGRRLGVGESRVSQLHSAALARLRTLLARIQ
jgi:RNA polymerase sigma factor for flagellar operon FliA